MGFLTASAGVFVVGYVLRVLYKDVENYRVQRGAADRRLFRRIRAQEIRRGQREDTDWRSEGF